MRWRDRPTRVFRRVALALGLVCPPAGYAGISLVVAHLLTVPNNRHVPVDPRRLGAEAHDWQAITEDGLTLRGWYYPTAVRRHLIVCVHGMKMDWTELAGVGRDLHLRGYDVLLFDLRGHGRSDSARLSMGRFERRDLRAVLEWARGEGFPPERIGWIGSSMGAATLLMEGAANPEIRAAVLDSPFADLPVLLDRQLNAHSGLPTLFNPGILLAARLAFQVRTDDLVPLRDARLWSGRPLMLIHGAADTMVPAAHSRLIAREAGADCREFILAGVEHANAYRDHPGWYVETVDTFFRENLAP